MFRAPRASAFRAAGGFSKQFFQHQQRASGAGARPGGTPRSRASNRTFTSMPESIPRSMRPPLFSMPPEIGYMRTQYLQGRFFSAPVTTTSGSTLILTNLTAPATSATAESDSGALAASLGGPLDGVTSPVTDTLSKLNFSYSIIDVAMLLQLRPLLWARSFFGGGAKLESDLAVLAPSGFVGGRFALGAAGGLVVTDGASGAASLTSDAVETAETLAAVAHQIGDLREMGLCHATPPGALQFLMEAIHVGSGLPWFATIAVSTLLIRLAVFPLYVSQQRMQAVMQRLKPQMDAIKLKISEFRANGQQAEMQQEALKMQRMFKDNNVNPLQMVALSLVSAFLFISFFMGLRAMAALPVPGFETGGFGWIRDLTLPDPYYILPVVSVATFLAMMELGAEMGAQVAQGSGMRALFRVMMLASLPFTVGFPAGVHCYWVTSNFFTFASMALFRVPAVRRFFRVPIVDSRALQQLAAAASGNASAGLLATKRMTWREGWQASRAATSQAAHFSGKVSSEGVGRVV